MAFDHDFDAIAITPPGHGNTTQVEEEGSGFWSPGNFLKHALESCLGVALARTVVVSHSNFVTRKFFLPFLMVRAPHRPTCGRQNSVEAHSHRRRKLRRTLSTLPCLTSDMDLYG